MSEPDAVPLPREGEVFFDVRGETRCMRLSWYADSAIAVFSIWQGNRCTATFRLPFADLGRMVDTLQSGPPAYGHETAYRQQSEYESRSDYESEPDYATEYQSGPAYNRDTRYGAEPEYQPAAPYAAGDEYRTRQDYPLQDYRSGLGYGQGNDYLPGHGHGGERVSGDHPRQQYPTGGHDREVRYHAAHSTSDPDSTAPGYGPDRYGAVQPGLHGDPGFVASTPGYQHLDYAGRPVPAAPYGETYPGEARHRRFPAEPANTGQADHDWDAATAAYRDH